MLVTAGHFHARLIPLVECLKALCLRRFENDLDTEMAVSRMEGLRIAQEASRVSRFVLTLEIFPIKLLSFCDVEITIFQNLFSLLFLSMGHIIKKLDVLKVVQ